MEFSSTSNSLANEFFLNSSAQPLNDEPYTDDGWSFREVKLFEKTFAEFRGIASVAFFEEAARRLYWKDMNSIVQHYEILMKDLKMIEEGKVGYRIQMEENGSAHVGEPESPVMGKERKKYTSWTAEEHRLFLMGLNEYGKGKWTKISKNYVKTKNPTQVASHGQKFNSRTISKTPDKKRRRSIHDIRSADPAPAENVVPANDHAIMPPPPPPPAPQVFPNSYYGCVATGPVLPPPPPPPAPQVFPNNYYGCVATVPPPPPSPAPQVFPNNYYGCVATRPGHETVIGNQQVIPNNYYGCVANGAGHETIFGNQYLMPQPWINHWYSPDDHLNE